MLRKDKQINDIAVINDILNSAAVCRLGLSEDNQPYVVPLCFGYRDNALYFHTGVVGRKIDIIKENNRVCFEIDIDCEPVEGEKPCDWNMKYKSVIGFGKAVLIENVEAKRKALDIIMGHYTDGPFEYPEEAVNKTAIIKVEIETMTGKKSGY